MDIGYGYEGHTLKTLQELDQVFCAWLSEGLFYIIENIARIANAVQVTICLLVSTSVF